MNQINDSFNTKVIDGVGWKFAEKIGVQIIQLVIQIILARILLPEEFGVVGLLSIFIYILEVFISQGLSLSIIQKKDIDEIDLSSTFYINILLSIAIYGLLFISAPFISELFNNSSYIMYLRVLGLIIVFGAFCSVQNSLLSRNLDYKKSFFRHSFNIVTQGISGIILARLGFGVWSLVLSKVIGEFVGSIILIVSVDWKPQLCFSFNRVKILFSFGSKVLLTNLFNTVFNNITSFLIGIFFEPIEVGFYQKGQQVPQTIMVAIDGSMNEVMFSALSRIQTDIGYLKSYMRKFIRTSYYFVLPLMIGLILVSEKAVLVVLTDKWYRCIPFLRIQCLICLIWPLSAIINALNALGKSSLTLAFSIISKCLFIFFALIFLKKGVEGIMIGALIASIISTIISLLVSYKYIHYSLLEFLKDLKKIFFITTIMSICVLTISFIGINNDFILLFIQISVGIFSYIFLSYLFKEESFLLLIDIIKNFKN